MAAITSAVVAAGTAYYGAEAQKDAADTSADAATAAAQLSQQQYQQTRSDQMPWLQAGQSALAQVQDLNSGDYSSFTESPDYQFAMDQGIKSVDRSGSARGTQYSGGQLAALADYSSGLASQNYSDYYNRIANLAGVGQTAATNIGTAGTSYASQAGSAIQNAGNAQSAAQIGSASTYGDAATQIADAFGEWYKNRKKDEEGG